MPNGANFVHKQLRTELENYIKSQYFGKSPILLSALNNHIDDEGLLYQRPFIESSPAYVTVQNGIETASLENWMKEYFLQLAKAGIGVFPSPFAHQISALEAATRGENLFVSTGTGSGKTECFMWPLLAKMAAEARNSKESWAKRGIRTIIMYPMNALVSDQVSRLRRMIGDPDNKFIKIFRDTCGTGVRRPQFGMYTGRTPYPGDLPSTEQDRKLERTLARMSFPQSDSEKEFFNCLLKEGKIPAKADMNQFLQSVYNWMYENLVYYHPFHELIKNCRGNAVSLGELSSDIFPELNPEDALKAVSVLLAIAPLAKNAKGSVLFPARMHMLFKGISGVYACTNANCSCSHSEGGLTLGEIYLSDGNLICPHCGSVVYELYNDRRCGALFFKGYVLEDDSGLHGNVYLWHYPGQLMDCRMKEIHLFIPTDDFELPAKQGKNAIRPCYLDIKSGFINFTDDASAGKPWIRKLYYCNYSAKGRPQIITFPTCPHCRHQLSTSQLTSFNTRGNQSFFNLIKAQFQLQPAVPGKDNDPDRFPNEGRKVLLFSDSRQRAAKLARDMSEASDISAARQLFAIAIKTMEEQTVEQSMNSLYDYFCLAAGQHHVQIFHAPERIKFAEDCTTALNNYNRCVKRGREYAPRFTIANAPV